MLIILLILTYHPYKLNRFSPTSSHNRHQTSQYPRNTSLVLTHFTLFPSIQVLDQFFIANFNFVGFCDRIEVFRILFANTENVLRKKCFSSWGEEILTIQIRSDLSISKTLWIQLIYCFDQLHLIVGYLILIKVNVWNCCSKAVVMRNIFWVINPSEPNYSTVTDFARLRGLSTSVPFNNAAW